MTLGTAILFCVWGSAQLPTCKGDPALKCFLYLKIGFNDIYIIHMLNFREEISPVILLLMLLQLIFLDILSVEYDKNMFMIIITESF